MKSRKPFLSITTGALVLLGSWLVIPAWSIAAVNLFDQPVLHPAIPLLDDAGRHVLDTGNPYSARQSCGNGAGGGCHDYAKITRAYHFQQGRDEAGDDFGAKRGLPQLVSPGYFGGYNCMSISQPAWLAKKFNRNPGEFGDLGSADAIRACGECHAGGGWGELDRDGIRYDQKPASTLKANDGDYFSRQPVMFWQGNPVIGPTQLAPWDWQRSGVKEADCLHCHVDFQALRKFPLSGLGAADGSDGSASAVSHYRYLRDEKFTRAGWFRWANSAVLEFLDLRPDLPEGQNLLTVARQPSASAPLPNYELALDSSGKPKLNWNPAAFDASRKVRMPLLRFPASDNCMTCHETSIERRGFYGFGEESRETFGANGALLADHRDDIHKGVSWTEDTGENRITDNCNACHSKQYYKAGSANIDLDADHDFPKGNGDNDVRNDLDNQPSATPCEHCHDEAKKPALPSGNPDVLSAHRDLWRTNGDMAGYPLESLDKITTSHLDTVACQTCHVRGLADNQQPIQIRYRFRSGYRGDLKIFPYKPAYRYLTQDRRSGRMLYRHELLSVFEARGENGGTANFAIVDPRTRQELAQATRGPNGFPEPTTYAGYKALKQAYDSLLRGKGYGRPDVRFVYIESNEYVLSHNTRPAVEALQCADCHQRDAAGAFDKQVSDQGVLGSGNVAEVVRLPDRRLVEDGIFELGMPYFRVQDDGRITENEADILYSSRLDPSMSILKAETSRVIEAPFKQLPRDQALLFTGMTDDSRQALAAQAQGGEALLFSSRVGHDSLRRFALLQFADPRIASLGASLRAEVQSRSPAFSDRTNLRRSGLGEVAADIYSLTLKDENGRRLNRFAAGPGYLKLPYKGVASSPAGVRVAVSRNGKAWRPVRSRDVVGFQPQGGSGGYVVIRTNRPYKFITVADRRPPQRHGTKQ